MTKCTISNLSRGLKNVLGNHHRNPDPSDRIYLDREYVVGETRDRISFQGTLKIKKNEQQNVLSTSSNEEDIVMLLEATIAMFVLMGITWVGAIWASYQEPRKTHFNSTLLKFPARKAA
jgi:hypothetical protein